MIFCPVQGPPFVRIDGERRDGTMADLEQLMRLTQMTDALDTPGRNMLEPNDIPLDSRHLLRALAAVRLTDRVWAGEPSSEAAARDCIRMIEIVHGGLDGDPVVFVNVNVNSPLRYDVRMLEGLIAYAEAGQAVIVTPFLLMGAMAPVSVPAALVQQTVEVLAGVALAQLVRPGAPCVMGSFLSSTDMQSGSPAFGGPESAVGLYASGQIARRLGLPWRSGGGTLTASQSVDYQAGYESFNTLIAAFLGGANVCWQSAGWLEGGLVTSFEKFAADCEILDLLQRQFAPLEVDEASLAFDAHVEVGQGGHFFGAQHTLERFRECFWRPTVASTENFDRWTKNGSLDHAARASRRWKALLEQYEQPPLDAGDRGGAGRVRRAARRRGRRHGLGALERRRVAERPGPQALQERLPGRVAAASTARAASASSAPSASMSTCTGAPSRTSTRPPTTTSRTCPRPALATTRSS